MLVPTLLECADTEHFSSLQKMILDSIALEQVRVGAVSINILEKKKQERVEVKVIKDILKWMKGSG